MSKLTGTTQTQIQPVKFDSLAGFWADLEALLGQPHAAEVHLAMLPQEDGGMVAQGTIIHRPEVKPAALEVVDGDAQ